VRHDIGTFSSGHMLNVEAGGNWVKAYSTLTSNRLERIEKLPAGFTDNYKPAIAQ
jgi:hypothetical protein